MSVQAAMDYIQHLRAHPTTAPEPRSRSLGIDLQEVVDVAKRIGYDFSVDDLRAAFRHDWQLRWQRYGIARQG